MFRTGHCSTFSPLGKIYSPIPSRYALRPKSPVPPMTLAIFDLDNTLLTGDSDHSWGQWVCDAGLVDTASYSRRNEAFFADYQRGDLDIEAYLRFALSPLKNQNIQTAAQWHDKFMAERVLPMVHAPARELIEKHRRMGDTLLVITATNAFITRPIIELFGIEHLLACEAEVVDGHYTGEPLGIPTYREGKVQRLQLWCDEYDESVDGAWFYSDSHNDLPLLEVVDHPVVVDPDDRLRQIAGERQWPVISLRPVDP